MNLPVQFDGLANVSLPARPLHLAIGMFDGVHLGHRAVIETAVEAARRSGGVAAVLTFWPHPSVLFRPEQPTRLIQDGPTKARALGRLGVDAVVTQPFTREFAQLAAADFLPALKQSLPTLAGIYVGENFRFGRGRSGDVTMLAAAAEALGLAIFCASRVTVGGLPVSSTRIRELLEAGEVDAANTLLGQPYATHGVVTPGKRLGRSLGFPTLNLAWSPPLRPRLGVYVARVCGVASVAARPAVANYGLRPTVEQVTAPRLEVHVLGECPFGEGEEISVEWLRFLRAEMKFGGVDELRAQIARDREAAAQFFAAEGRRI